VNPCVLVVIICEKGEISWSWKQCNWFWST
jgi:hypothetical protein